MALTWTAVLNTAAAPANSTGVNPALMPPDNCHTVLIYNAGSNPLLVSNSGVAAGTVLAAGSNALILPVGGSVALGIGLLAQRGSLATNGFCYGGAGGGTSAIITYLSAIGE